MFATTVSATNEANLGKISHATKLNRADLESRHNKADCPKPRAVSDGCRRCGREGHWSKGCLQAPIMECRECGSTEHLAKDCPNRICKNCGQPGKQYL